MEILDHWLIQFVIVSAIIIVPVIFIGKHFLRYKTEKFELENEYREDKQHKLDSIAGKINFAIENTDTAYNELMKQKKEAQENMQKATGEDRKIWERKVKSVDTQLKVVLKIMENKDIVDMSKGFIVPLISKLEGGAKKFLKNGLGGF